MEGTANKGLALMLSGLVEREVCSSGEHGGQGGRRPGMGDVGQTQ